MLSNEEKEFIIGFWKKMGRVSFKDSVYIGRKIPTYEDYLKLIAEFYGIENDVDVLYSYIEKFTEDLLNGLVSCNTTMTVKSIKPNFDIQSTSNMSIIYNGMGGSNKLSFTYTVDPDFECPEYYDEEFIEYDLQCFDDLCISPLVRKVLRIVENKFGIRISNIEYSIKKD